MDRERFKEKLIRATELAIEKTRAMVVESIPDAFDLLVFVNRSMDARNADCCAPFAPYEENDGPLRFGAVDDALPFLWRDGKVPKGISVHVISEDAKKSLIKLDCWGLFTDDDKDLYENGEGLAPFAAYGPSIPNRFRDPDGFVCWRKGVDKRFSLYWERDIRYPLRTRIRGRLYLIAYDLKKMIRTAFGRT